MGMGAVGIKDLKTPVLPLNTRVLTWIKSALTYAADQGWRGLGEAISVTQDIVVRLCTGFAPVIDRLCTAYPNRLIYNDLKT